MNNLTTNEKFWLLSNIKKDEEELFEKIKMCLKIMKPEAFKNEEDSDTVNAADTFTEEIEKQLGRKLSEEEKQTMTLDDEIDKIERIE